jgi:uncharacterized membrane protein
MSRMTGFLVTLKKDREMQKRLIGIAAFTLAYPALELVVRYIPNPMVPGAIIALNMILPVLAGYFYGPWSGAFAGGAGTGIAALLGGSVFNYLAIIPNAIMGGVAGFSGRFRSEFLTASTILVGHSLNMLVFIGAGVITIPAEKAGTTLLGLAAESMVDIIAIVLLLHLLKRYLYCPERW